MISTLSVLTILAVAVFMFFLDIQVRAENNNEPFVLDDTAEVLDGITLAAQQGDITRGAVLGEVTATAGTYKVCDAIATDGSEIPKLLLSTLDVASDASTTTNLSAYTRGLFDENQLVFGGSTDIDTRLNTELMPNSDDRTCHSDGAWANVDLTGAFTLDGSLTITASDAAAEFCTLPIASFPTDIGKTYKMSYDLASVSGTWLIKDFTGLQTIGTIAANVTQGVITWLANTTGGLRMVASDSSSSGIFDNFTLARTGDLSDKTMKDLLRNVGIRVTPGISVSGSENT